LPSYRVIKSGHILEVYKYQRSISRGYDDDFKSVGGGRDKEGQVERKVEYAATVSQRARNKIRRLINANFDKESAFITLTYAENMTDIEKGSHDFKKFIQKMNRKQKGFQYVAVIEFQKRGAIHYHMLCNYKCTWNNLEELQALERALGKAWGQGFVDIGYKDNDNAGAYLIKYMTKENNDDRLRGKKSYFFSRNLEQPKELIGGEAVEAIKKFENLPPVFSNQYYSDFHGKVEFFEYNPLRYDYQEYKNTISLLEENCVNEAIKLFGDDVEVYE
jgi:hypothetical protein